MTDETQRILYFDKAMKQSKTTAMNTLLYFIRKGSLIFPEKYDQSLTLWKKVVEKRSNLTKEKDPDRFVPVCDAEKYLRKNFLSVVFNTTALYGNTEIKRIYSWKEGTIGPLNVLLNRAGAHLRFLAMTRYPFPIPHRRNVRRINDDIGTKYFKWDYVYGGTKNRPTVIITHPMLPSLDFVDAIRGHLIELCRVCFTRSVPISDSTRYIKLLTFRLRPLLDEFYFACFEKRKRNYDFTKRSLAVLDSVLTRVEGQHGVTSGYPLRMTSDLEEVNLSFHGIDDLIDKVDDLTIKGILTQKKDLIDDTSVARFASKINATISRAGTRIHKRMAWGITQPFSAMSVMLGGDHLARDTTGYLLAAEVPVNAGRGKVDYTLFVRKEPEYMEDVTDTSSGLWPPRLVLDLKTKTAFNWGVCAKSYHSTKSHVANFPLKKRLLTDLEWEVLTKNTPTDTEKKQVEAYAKGQIEEYRRIVKDDLKPPSTSLEGIILVDAHDFPSRARRLLPKFINEVYEHIREDITSMRITDPDGELKYPRMLFEPTLRWSIKTRVAIVVFPFTVPKGVAVQDILPLPIPQQSLSEFDPFENRKDDSRHFILYLSADDVSSPGDSAGWIAQHWHGLWFASDIAKEQDYRKVIWIDLAGEFANEMVRGAILHQVSHHSSIRQFYNNVEFFDFSPEIEKGLFAGEEMLSAETIRARVKDYDLVIVSGIDTVREIVPSELEGLVDTLVLHVANATSQLGTTTIWFGTSSPLATTSLLYKRNQLRPFRHNEDDLKREVVKQLIVDGPQTWDELRELTGLDPQSLNKLLSNLFNGKIISKEIDGGYRLEFGVESEFVETIRKEERIEGGVDDFEQDWDDDSYEDRMKE